MPRYKVVVRATWTVEADSEEAAREKIVPTSLPSVYDIRDPDDWAIEHVYETSEVPDAKA